MAARAPRSILAITVLVFLFLHLPDHKAAGMAGGGWRPCQ